MDRLLLFIGMAVVIVPGRTLWWSRNSTLELQGDVQRERTEQWLNRCSCWRRAWITEGGGTLWVVAFNRDTAWATSVFLTVLETSIKETTPQICSFLTQGLSSIVFMRHPSLICTLHPWAWSCWLEAQPFTYSSRVPSSRKLCVALGREYERSIKGLRRPHLREHDGCDQGNHRRKQFSCWEDPWRRPWSRGGGQNCREQEMCWMKDKRHTEEGRQEDGCFRCKDFDIIHNVISVTVKQFYRGENRSPEQWKALWPSLCDWNFSLRSPDFKGVVSKTNKSSQYLW